MKKIVTVATAILIMFQYATAQEPIKPAQFGFDTVRANIAHGKIDTVTYQSKTVGTKRKSHHLYTTWLCKK